MGSCSLGSCEVGMSSADVTVWHGSSEEAMRLINVVNGYCQCPALRHRCPAHDMLVDQYTLDHLIFLRWLHLKGADSCTKPSLSSR